MSFAGKITYNSIDINLPRRWNSFLFSKKQFQSKNIAGSGITEYINWYNQDFVNAVLEGNAWGQHILELLEFYDYVRNGSSFTLVRDRDLGAYYGFEKTLNNNDETALTFTRTAGSANNASYIDPSTGYISFEDVADTARYSAGKYGHGLIIEGSRTNICQQSINFQAAGWMDSASCTTTAGTTETDDIEGGSNANKIVTSAGGHFVEYITSQAMGAITFVLSVYVKCESGTAAGSLQAVDYNDGLQTETSFTATTEWQRIQITDTNTGSSGDLKLRIKLDNADTLYATHAQIEIGSGVKFASNFIKSEGSSLARNSELALGTCANVVGRKKGTIGFWFKPEYGTGIGTTRMLFHSGADGTNRHVSIGINSSNNWEIRVYRSNGSSYASIGGSASQIAQDTQIHLCLTYDSTISNGLNWYINGSLVSTSTNDAFDASEIGTNFALGSFIAGGSEAFGVFDDLFIRKDVLSASQIKDIYNKTYGLGLRRNRWASMALTNPKFNPVQKTGNRYDFNLECEEVLS